MKTLLCKWLSICLMLSSGLYSGLCSPLQVQSERGTLQYLGSYAFGVSNPEGGVAEIVKYNPENQCMYVVSGQLQSVDIVSLAEMDINRKQNNSFALQKRLDIRDMGAANGFAYGDITSLAISTQKGLIALAVQAEHYTSPGSIVLLNYDGTYITHFDTGVQPDMVCFSPDGNYVVTANEGEPRDGYDGIDPMGSVSVLCLQGGQAAWQVKTLDFTAFDARREQLLAQKVLLKTGAMPSQDLEPEYVAIAEDGVTAYVTLQEANAIATVNLQEGRVIDIQGLGFKDHSQAGNGLDMIKDGEICIQNQNVFGVYMPDGLAVATIDNVQYILTANEGDGRQWPGYTNTESKTVGVTGKKVEQLLHDETQGLARNQTYLLGARSFSIWRGDTLQQVFDSGEDFETITARQFPQHFNCNHKNPKLETRSNQKGPEPEDITILSAYGRTFALIGLERVGGVMLYDITIPGSAYYVDYMNIRDFSTTSIDNGSHLGPEGICALSAQQSPTGQPLILVANEISGTVSVIGMNKTVLAR